MPPIPAFVTDDLQRLAIDVPERELILLSQYLDLLLEANQQFNLTAVRDRDEAWRRHIIDSLTLLPVLASEADGAAVIDVGSGGGLPGVPLAITQSRLRFTLLEATGKKARFLQKCVTELKLVNTTVLNSRAEAAGQDSAHRQHYDVAVCRAVGPMRELLEYTLPLVKVGGTLVAMKGPKVEAELREASDALAALGAGELAVEPAYPDDFNMDAVIVSIEKDRPTPKEYPRLPGMPRHDPL